MSEWMKIGWCLLLVVCLLVMPAAVFAEDDDDEDSDNEALEKRITELEKKLAEIEKQKERYEKRHQALAWEQDRDFFWLPNGWTISVHGEFRGRALIEANTINAYTNYAGERIYAYDPKSTLSNDYGWWDQRFQMRTVVNFGDTADFVSRIQIGNSVWGSRARLWGDQGEGKFDQVTIMFRELYARFSIDPIPLWMEFGRMPWELGNRMILGNEHDGTRWFYRHKYFEIGAGAFRQYEGENYEMAMKYNDDEDTFVGWVDITPKADQRVSMFGYVDDLKVTAKPNELDLASPLPLLTGFDQDLYEGQESQLWSLGANWVGTFRDVTLNLEYDHQFGQLNAHPDRGAEDIGFRGFAGQARVDWKLFNTETIVLNTGYGSGDDPDTPNYEGFFAPDNDYGIKEEDMDEYRKRAYFSVYEFLSPGAGVPGRLFDDLGSGGIENTIFALLGWDSYFQANHHYWLSLGYIQAAEENPETGDDMIGIELDTRVDYLFSNNVIFSIYGGHLFMLGDYFRENAHDAAQLYFEWKLRW